MKERVLIRAGYTLLGALLAVIIMLLAKDIKGKQEDTVAVATEASIETVEILPETETVPANDYDAEAEEKLNALKEQASTPAVSTESVSANSIEAAKVKWKVDYPMINSDKTLEENQNIRSSYEETLATNAFDKKVIANSTIDFSDIKITIMGDSLTEGSNLSEEDRKKYAYPVILQQLLGCKEIINLGIGGSTINRISNSYAMVDRWNDIPQDSDIVIVFGGSNDCLFENKWDFGELEYEHRMTKGTFCGDLDEMLGGIKYVYRDNNLNSYIKFLYINPPSTILNDAVYATDPGNMVPQSEFANAINEIAPAYGFEVIDLYNNNILNSHDKDINANLVTDGIHPNAEGYQILAEHIASEIIQRIDQ